MIILHITIIFFNLFVIFFPLFLKLKPPKRPNMWYGYRTQRSLKNLSNWNYANYHFPNALFTLGIIILIIFVVLTNWINLIVSFLISIFAYIIGLFISIFITEQKLKNFEKKEI